MKEMENGISNGSLKGICLAGAAGGFLLLYLCIPFTYGINDDMTMRDIAAGAVSGSPDGHLVYMQYVLGKALSLLFRIFPGADWYALFLILAMLLCFALVEYRLLTLWRESKGRTWFGLLVSAVLLAQICLRYFVNFQYTVVASITGGTAVFFCYTADPEKKTAARLREYAAVLLLLWLTYCIRVQVFLLMVPFGGLMLLFKKGIRKAEKAGLLLAALLGLLLIGLTEKNAYSSEAWKSFRALNQARTDIFDYYGVPSYAENQEFYESIGMEECDIVNLERYNLYFVEGIENGTLEKTADCAKQLWEEGSSTGQKIKEGIRLAAQGFLDQSNLLLNAAGKLLLIGSAVWAVRKRKGLWNCLALAAAEGMLWFYLGFRGRLPDRVGAALLFFSGSCALALLYENCKGRKKDLLAVPKPAAAGIFLLAAALGVCSGISVRAEQLETVQRNQEFELFQAWFAEHGENGYFYPAAFLGGYTENVRLFRNFELKNHFLLGGWLAFSPVEAEGLEKFGILEVDKALVEKDNIYLVMTNPSGRVEEHYLQKNTEITWEQADQVPAFQTQIPVWKLHAEGDGT